MLKIELGNTLLDLIAGCTGSCRLGKVTLHIHRHTGAGKAFRHHLQSDCFTGAGSAGDQAVTIGYAQLSFFEVLAKHYCWGNVLASGGFGNLFG